METILNEETATSPRKHYTISLEVEGPDGSLRSCDMRVTPTGSCATCQAKFWMQLYANLTKYLTTKGHVEVVSSRLGRPKGLVD